MKRSNKRGFTLVELVIVIAVIAILAGVMIATFAGVVNDAKESAKLQEAQQAELNQKIEDVTAKLENANWLTWEDFENELAEQLATINVNDSTLTEESVKAAIDAALNKYAEKNAGEDKNTGLTDEQINLIVERTLAGSMTQGQVEAIVKKYAANNLTAAQISSIVNSAMANSLTAAEVRAIVTTELGGAVAEIEQGMLTAEEIEAIVKKYADASLSPVATGDELCDAIDNANDGDVIKLAGKNGSVTLTTKVTISKNVTLDLDGQTLTTENPITVAKGATVTIKGDGEMMKENAQKGNSAVLKVEGNIVIEDGTFIGGYYGEPTIRVEKGATLVINDGEFKTLDSSVTGRTNWYALGVWADTNVVINGGTFEAPCALATNGSGSSNAQLVINGGVFTSTSSTVIYWPAGRLDIYGGEFYGNSTIAAVCGGTVNVMGGTYVTDFTGSVVSKENGNDGVFADNASVFCVVTKRNGYAYVSFNINETAVTVEIPEDTFVVKTYENAVFTASEE